MFPDNEFWQCPSYTYSSLVLGTIVGLIIIFTFMIGGDKYGSIAVSAGGLFMTFWVLRTLLHWFIPNAKCATVGYPGQHYGNPFYSPVMDYSSPVIKGYY